MVPIITLSELKRLIDTHGNYVLIDVREPAELNFGMIPTAKNIPLGELEEALSLPPAEFENKYHFSHPKKDSNLIFHCRTGGRSEAATKLALAKGYTNASNFKGSIWEWSTIDPRVQRYGPGPNPDPKKTF